ncbi:MAG: L-histidine N(alpha)-methyltransferase, partial [Burkholderiaceae bacterium]
DADFDVRQWQHRAFFNAQQNRIEMHLEAKCPLVVSWTGAQRQFEKGESIHTENSYKYTREGFTQLLHPAGFATANIWTDERTWFMVCHARAV